MPHVIAAACLKPKLKKAKLKLGLFNIGQLLTLSLSIFLSNLAQAGSLEQAKTLHDRIAGVPASAAVLEAMAGKIDEGDNIAAAYLAMDNPDFYNTTVKIFASPWTNKDQDVFEPLNDYSATVIGMVRDDVDFRQILQADTVYVATDIPGIAAYSPSNNNHYQNLEDQAIDLQSALSSQTQSSFSGLPAQASAGILTSRAAAKAFFYLGTNRAMLRFTLMNHLCTDLEPIKDNTLPPDRIRQDVSRSPGGDSRLFLNNCLACHSGMDPLAQAFAYYDYDFDSEADPEGELGRLVYNQEGDIDSRTASRVQAKYHFNNTTFPYGYATPDDQWQNYWRQGSNQKLGWDAQLTGQGSGAKSMGQELANSEAFAACQVKKVFSNVCLREPDSSNDVQQINTSTASFKQNGYQLKRVFAELGSYCMAE